MPESKPKILLAEDDLHLGMLLVEFLENEGFDVKLCQDGMVALKAIAGGNFDLFLFDVMMPKMDGFKLAQEIKSTHSHIPLIFITARSLKEDKMKGYESGADDYITKPFDEEELLWKIRALLRRVPETKPEKTVQPVFIGQYCLDAANQSLSFNGSLKRITEKESALLFFLSENRNRLIKRNEILNAVWGTDDYFAGRSLDVFMTRIRKYIGKDTSLRIENVFKSGYILHVPGGENS